MYLNPDEDLLEENKVVAVERQIRSSRERQVLAGKLARRYLDAHLNLLANVSLLMTY